MEWVLIIGSWFGAIITIFCYIPQTIKTVFTWSTHSLSKWFFILGFMSSCGWILGSVASFVVNGGFSQLDIAVLVANIFGFICNLVLIIYKMINIKRAKKLKLTEQDYCAKVYEEKLSNTKISKLIKIFDKL